MDFSRVINEAGNLLLKGIWCTTWVSLLSLAIAIVIAFVSCMMGLSKSKILRGISKFYIWLIRGTPLLVQALIIKYALPYAMQQIGFTSFRISIIGASVTALCLNAGAYMSEIFRGGIQAVDAGQVEAARSLGLSSLKTTMLVVLPQAVKITIPSIVNQFIITIKDTSILLAIGLPELVYYAKTYAASSMEYLSTYLVVAVFYLVVISLLHLLSKYVEKKFRYETKVSDRLNASALVNGEEVAEQ